MADPVVVRHSRICYLPGMSSQEQFLNVIDRDEAEARFRAALDLAPLGIEQVSLTDALGRVLASDVVARVDVPSDRPAHKRALLPLAEDLLALQRAAGGARRGVYREAANAGRAPAWIVQNLEAIETIEAKIHNEHDLLANLRLALALPVRIDADLARPRRGLGARSTTP